MGCYKKKGNGFIINIQGWDDLKYKLKVKSFIEVSKIDWMECSVLIFDWDFQKTSLQSFGRSMKSKK
jgi:hypothetical protein